MTTVATSKVREDTIDRVARDGERVVIERGGKPVAALVTVEDLKILEHLEDTVDVELAKKALREPGRVAWEDYKRRRRAKRK